jgi:hypothetical protein
MRSQYSLGCGNCSAAPTCGQSVDGVAYIADDVTTSRPSGWTLLAIALGVLALVKKGA